MTLPELESKPLARLSDAEVLRALRSRGDDLSTLRAFSFLVRMFTTAGKTRDDLRPGLNAAIGLLKLYARNFAPGHEEHPFPDGPGDVAAALMGDGPDRGPAWTSPIREAMIQEKKPRAASSKRHP